MDANPLDHHILDPRTGVAEKTGSLLIDDKAVRRLGKYPDLERLQPGDILLFADPRPGPAARLIIDSQVARGFAQRDAQWTHAGVYLRRDLMVEAVPFRVRFRKLWHYVPTHLMRVRRARAPRNPATFGYRLGLEMTTRVGEPYAAHLLWQLPLYRFFGVGRDGTGSSRGRVYCSQVIADSFAELKEGAICQDGPDLDPFIRVTPAHLSHSTVLTDVAVPWLSLEGG